MSPSLEVFRSRFLQPRTQRMAHPRRSAFRTTSHRLTEAPPKNAVHRAIAQPTSMFVVSTESMLRRGRESPSGWSDGQPSRADDKRLDCRIAVRGSYRISACKFGKAHSMVETRAVGANRPVLPSCSARDAKVSVMYPDTLEPGRALTEPGDEERAAFQALYGERGGRGCAIIGETPPNGPASLTALVGLGMCLIVRRWR